MGDDTEREKREREEREKRKRNKEKEREKIERAETPHAPTITGKKVFSRFFLLSFSLRRKPERKLMGHKRVNGGSGNIRMINCFRRVSTH